MGVVTGPFECANCHGVTLHFSHARAAALADDFMLDVIHRYKYSRALYFEPFLAGVLLEQAVPALITGHWDMVVPVPLHPVKEREREFNQAERLARHLARALQVPLHARVVRRVRMTETQTHLNREERAENMKGAFAPRQAGELSGLRVVLVDDVMTTCATTNACAGALREAGAAEVCVWTVARGR
jgi:ComF family protein